MAKKNEDQTWEDRFSDPRYADAFQDAVAEEEHPGVIDEDDEIGCY